MSIWLAPGKTLTMPTWLDIAVAVVVVIGGVCTAIAFAVKFILLPWLRYNLVEPVKKTHHTVTTNHHTSEEPTLLDRLGDIRDDVATVREDQAGLISATAANTRQIEELKEQFDRHIANGDG
ncbi:MAG TPA: hypothetical protein VFH56_14415 [Acidimicrobiales bacterium]|nr:hypothetical protein [Acidimicrobiales bacterium]